MVNEKDAGHGRIFLGKDKDTYGEKGTGWVAYDPDFECGGNSPDRQCPFITEHRHIQEYKGMALSGSEGRLLHVGIASYRDPLCPKTLYNMFTKAKHPEKIRVRVIQQNEQEDVDCLEGYCDLMLKDHQEQNNQEEFKCPFASNVFIHSVEAKDAKGPTFARALLSADVFTSYQEGKVSPQDHCLSMDSHMDFEPQFDESLVDMWDAARNEYAVLSTYVADIEQMGVNLNGKHEVPHLCMVTFTSSVRTHATKCAQNLSRPKLTNCVYGAGLAFSKCHAELKVPVDPHTPYVFDGEEFNRGARFFTHGYDIYTPNRVFVLHNYHESQSNPKTGTWWKNTQRDALFESNSRLNNLLDIPLGGRKMTPDEKILLRQSKYGLGDRRSLDQLIEFSGIDLRNAKPTIDGKNYCGNLRWVPFVEHINGVNYIPPFDSDENPIDDYDEASVWHGQPLAHVNRVKDNLAHAQHIPDEHNILKPILTPAEKLGETISEKRKLRTVAQSLTKGLGDELSSLRTASAMLVSRRPESVADLPLPVQVSVIFLMFGLFGSFVIAFKTQKNGLGRYGHKRQ